MSAQPGALRLADHIERLIPGDPLASALRRLHQADLSNQEWLDKTDWVQATIQPSELGQHRADVIKQRLDLMTAQRDALLAACLRVDKAFANAGDWPDTSSELMELHEAINAMRFALPEAGAKATGDAA